MAWQRSHHGEGKFRKSLSGGSFWSLLVPTVSVSSASEHPGDHLPGCSAFRHRHIVNEPPWIHFPVLAFPSQSPVPQRQWGGDERVSFTERLWRPHYVPDVVTEARDTGKVTDEDPARTDMAGQ